MQTLEELAKRVAEERAAEPAPLAEPKVLKDSRGRLYVAGPVMRRHPQTARSALSKRDRAKLKRQAERNPRPAGAMITISTKNVISS